MHKKSKSQERAVCDVRVKPIECTSHKTRIHLHDINWSTLVMLLLFFHFNYVSIMCIFDDTFVERATIFPALKVAAKWIVELFNTLQKDTHQLQLILL